MNSPVADRLGVCPVCLSARRPGIALALLCGATGWAWVDPGAAVLAAVVGFFAGKTADSARRTLRER